MDALEAQVKQLGLQAERDCDRMARDRTLTLQLLHKVSFLLTTAEAGGMLSIHNTQIWRAGTTDEYVLANSVIRSKKGCYRWKRGTMI